MIDLNINILSTNCKHLEELNLHNFIQYKHPQKLCHLKHYFIINLVVITQKKYKLVQR